MLTQSMIDCQWVIMGISLLYYSNDFSNLTIEELNCIRWHMGFSEPSEHWNSLRGAMLAYPNVTWTVQADLISSIQEDKKKEV